MSGEQPLALRLADWIESPTFGRTRPEGDMHRAIAAELRRLHAVEQERPALVREAHENKQRARSLEQERDEARSERNIEAAARSRLAAERDKLHAEVEALRADAERYQWVRSWARGIRAVDNCPAFKLPHVPVPNGIDIMRGSVSQHLDAAIDAARGRA